MQKTLTSENSEINGHSYELFRYYDPDSGNYLSQDPIGLDGGRQFYGYVIDPNSWVDSFGLSATHGHHSDPKFMEGDPKQKLTTLSQSDHIQLHRDLNTHLETKTKVIKGQTVSMRPKRGNSGATIRGNFSREERLDALAEFYHNNKSKYPDAHADFFAQHPHLQKTGCPP
jgi:RHS repeat-associated protein